MKTSLVLISGAGPTGLTLACELARLGVPHRIIEAAFGPQPGSRGKGIQPRTLEVFEDMGIVEHVLAHGRIGMPMRVVTSDGKETVETAPTEPRPYPASLITPSGGSRETLRMRVEALGGQVEYDVPLRDSAQRDDGVSANNGEIEAAYLIGCDGGHSTVRKQAGIAFVGETRDEMRMIVADLEVDGLDRDAWHLWRHPEGLFSLCPLPSQESVPVSGQLFGLLRHRDLERLDGVLELGALVESLRLEIGELGAQLVCLGRDSPPAPFAHFLRCSNACGMRATASRSPRSPHLTSHISSRSPPVVLETIAPANDPPGLRLRHSWQ
jgi:2-polyprenyl-6-methoxyphenol hydroxylase-like FAD-dependent oxidoreductase